MISSVIFAWIIINGLQVHASWSACFSSWNVFILFSRFFICIVQIEDFQIINFFPMNIAEEDSMDYILQMIDMTMQVHQLGWFMF